MNTALWLLEQRLTYRHNLTRGHMDAWSSQPNHLPRGNSTKIKTVAKKQKKNLSNPFPSSDRKIRRINQGRL